MARRTVLVETSRRAATATMLSMREAAGGSLVMRDRPFGKRRTDGMDRWAAAPGRQPPYAASRTDAGAPWGLPAGCGPSPSSPAEGRLGRRLRWRKAPTRMPGSFHHDHRRAIPDSAQRAGLLDAMTRKAAAKAGISRGSFFCLHRHKALAPIRVATRRGGRWG